MTTQEFNKLQDDIEEYEWQEYLWRTLFHIHTKYNYRGSWSLENFKHMWE